MHSSIRRLLRPILVGLCLLFLVSCEQPPPPSETAQIYTVRGMVRQLPDPDRPGKEFLVRHEAIPDFADREGNVVGMETMSMPFPVDAALLSEIQPGDRIVFDFRMDWEGSPPVEVVRIEKLPEGTRLSFEKTAEEAQKEEGETPESPENPETPENEE